MKAEKWAATIAIIVIWIIPLAILGFSNEVKEAKNYTNESIIIVDNELNRAYTEHTDKLSLADSARSLESNQEINDQADLIISEKIKEEKRIAEELRIAEEKKIAEAERIEEEKRIAEEEVKRVELAKIAEEKKQTELALAEETERKRVEEVEAKRLADLKVKQAANNKAKEESKEKTVVQATVSRGEQNTDKWIAFEATHYTAFCNTGCIGITALGWDVSNTIYRNGYRIIAVDPNVIPLGSLVEVKTPYGSFKALAGDTGGAIKGNIVDILVADHGEAVRLGRVSVQIRIIK